jgi:hypothetical protein
MQQKNGMINMKMDWEYYLTREIKRESQIKGLGTVYLMVVADPIVSIIESVDGTRELYPFYVGLTTDLRQRMKSHIRHTEKARTIRFGERVEKKYHNMAKFLGERNTENIKFYLLETGIPVDSLQEREIYWINKLDAYKYGLNDSRGGEYYGKTNKKIAVVNG